MSQAQIDQVAAVKASLELMVAENAEIHEYFKDLLEKVAELEEETPEKRRSKFKDLVSMGAFRFNGLDIRHFTQSHHQPLPPPLFYGRTKRRLGNTLKLVEEFAKRDILADAAWLREQLEQLSSHIVNESDGNEVRGFKKKVDLLRESTPFRAYLETKSRFIRKDAELRAEADYLAAKESVEEGEEIFRQRAEELGALGDQIESGAMALEEAQVALDKLSLAGAPGAAASAEAGEGADAAPASGLRPGGEAAEVADVAPPAAPKPSPAAKPGAKPGAAGAGAKPGARPGAAAASKAKPGVGRKGAPPRAAR